MLSKLLNKKIFTNLLKFCKNTFLEYVFSSKESNQLILTAVKREIFELKPI